MTDMVNDLVERITNEEGHAYAWGGGGGLLILLLVVVLLIILL